MAAYSPNNRSYNYSYDAKRPYDQERAYSPAPPPKRRFGDLSHMSQKNRTALYCGVCCCLLILAAIIAIIIIAVFANGVNYGWRREGGFWGWGGGYGGGGYGRGGYGYGGYGK